MCVRIFSMRKCVCVVGAMNQWVMILLAVFVVGAVTLLIRAILFNLAGERFVARLRKNVSSQRIYENHSNHDTFYCPPLLSFLHLS